MTSLPDSLVLNARGGAQVCVPADLGQITTYVLLEQEDWFEDEIAFVRRWLQPGMRAIDVGANYGVYTMAMAKAVGAAGRIWAFEPSPRTAEYLQRSIDLNRCVQTSLMRQAISDRCGNVQFAIGAASELNAIATAHNAGEIINVPATTLDQAAIEQGWNGIDFIKLDVEGHERQAIYGAAHLLDRESPLIMFEVKAGDRMDLSVLEPMAAKGYEFYRLLPGPLLLTPFEPDEPLDGFQLNLFACKKDRARQIADSGFLAHPEESPRPAPEAWAKYVGATAYARGLSARWPAKAGFFARADDKLYLEGLAAFAAARDPECAASTRCSWLEHALSCVAESAAATDRPARKISYARLAWETGHRQLAVEMLSTAAGSLASIGDEALKEPFLAPAPRYERLDTAGRPLDWLQCAVIEQFEKLRAYSSRFSGDSALSVLKPILHLPFRSAEMDRRFQLVQMTHGMQDAPRATPALESSSDENLNAEFWAARRLQVQQPSSRPAGQFHIAALIVELPPIRIVDVGAMAIADPDAYAPIAATLDCEVVGFEPLDEECEKRNQHARPGCVYLPYVVGDGSVQTFYETNAGMTSSLFEPNTALLEMFDNLEEHVRVVATRKVQTRRLDDVEEARGADFLKADVQGAELMVFQGAQEILRDVLVIHAEAEFVPLYKNQPLFADVDAFLRGKGFVLHKMAHCAGRLFKPFSMKGNGGREPSQWLWCDAVYVRDFSTFEQLSAVQLLKLAAILHENYGSHDLAALALGTHDRKTGGNYKAQYLQRLEDPASR